MRSSLYLVRGRRFINKSLSYFNGLNKKLALASVSLVVLILFTSFGAGYTIGRSTQTVNESINITGWVIVEVVRDGKVIYHHEGPNLITNTGFNMIAKTFYFSINASQRAYNPNGTTVVALGNSTTSPTAGTTRLPTEINYGGISRKIGTVNYANATQGTLIIRRAYTATTNVQAVQQAALYNSITNATATGFFAWNTFTSVNLVNNDVITITWTFTLA